MFISLEGIDGSGKTTQARLLAKSLGADTVLVREPGGTDPGERVREVLKEPGLALDPMTELMLFLAARAQLCAEVIRPALEDGKVVVCDRFSDSSVAYQGVARGLGRELVRGLCDQATGGLWPDLTLMLRVDVATASARRGGRGEGDPIEDEGDEFQLRVARGYDQIQALNQGRVKLIDASNPPRDVQADIRQIVLDAIDAR